MARERLANISGILVDPEKFEALFSRVMSLVPPEAFADLLVHKPGDGLTDKQQQRLAEMVRLGYKTWKDFNDRFAKEQGKIRNQNPGLATWEDLRRFLAEHAGAVAAEGFRTLRFTQHDRDNEPVSVEIPVPVVKLLNGTHYLGQEHDGMPV